MNLVETLELCGLDRDEYQLNESVDVEALARLVHSSADDIEVRVSVEGIPLRVTPTGVQCVDSNT
jgi:hypothetical protein